MLAQCCSERLLTDNIRRAVGLHQLRCGPKIYEIVPRRMAQAVVVAALQGDICDRDDQTGNSNASGQADNRAKTAVMAAIIIPLPRFPPKAGSPNAGSGGA